MQYVSTLVHLSLPPPCRRVEVASPHFAGKPLLQRHRAVYTLLDDELKLHGVHAIALKTLTPEEYQAKIAQGDTPPPKASRPRVIAAAEGSAP